MLPHGGHATLFDVRDFMVNATNKAENAKDARDNHETTVHAIRHLDRMPSHFLGQTLKYLHLLFGGTRGSGYQRRNYHWGKESDTSETSELVSCAGESLLIEATAAVQF